MRKITIDVTEIQTRNELIALLENKIGFEGWHGPKLQDWIDMISVFEADNLNGLPSRFNSAEPEFYILEVVNASEMMLSNRRNGIFRQMILLFKEVNKAYSDQFGRPIIGLSLL